MPPAHHRTIWCRSTFGPRGPGLSRISNFLRPAQRYDDFKLIRITCQAACHGKTEHGYLSSLKTEQNCCCPHCRCHHLGYSVPPAHHRTIWCRSTFGPRGPGLSRISNFLRPAQRYDDFKLIRITCQAACHGKTEHGIFVKSCLENYPIVSTILEKQRYSIFKFTNALLL